MRKVRCGAVRCQQAMGIPCRFRSNQLREKGSSGDDDWFALFEAVGIDVVEIDCELEGVFCAGLRLEESQGVGESGSATGFDFGEEPGFAVAGDQKIDFALLLVPHKVQSKFAVTVFRPPVGRLQ